MTSVCEGKTGQCHSFYGRCYCCSTRGSVVAGVCSVWVRTMCAFLGHGEACPGNMGAQSDVQQP